MKKRKVGIYRGNCIATLEEEINEVLDRCPNYNILQVCFPPPITHGAVDEKGNGLLHHAMVLFEVEE